MSIGVHPWLTLLPLGFVWWQLLRQLSIEWSINPQYAYGYAVPFLCLYLFGRRLKQTRPGSEQQGSSGPNAIAPAAAPAPRAANLALAGLALLWLPLRLVQEANPDWRLVSWGMALEVVGMTWLALRRFWPGERARVPGWTFALGFFLVAVPWPTVIEQPVIQGLTRVITATTVESLNVAGIPALAHGNIIEVGSGAVGIDEACSGIRSLQATLMVALFCGELFRLSVAGRLLGVLAGFGFAFVTNLLRTTVLAVVAARHGLGASAGMHDLVGTALVVVCFVAMAWLSRRLSRGGGRAAPVFSAPIAKGGFYGRESGRGLPQSKTPAGIEGLAQLREEPGAGRGSGVFSAGELSRRFCAGSISTWRTPVALAFCLLLAELGTEAWYRVHETKLAAPVTWTVSLPEGNPSLRKLALSEDARRQLRCDEVINGIWEGGPGVKCQAVYLRWKPGRAAAYLAHTHTPEICLTAAGRELLAGPEVTTVSVRGLELPFRALVFREGAGVVRVFYCLWQDRGSVRENGPMALNYRRRVGPVLAGQRNCGQRALEVAFWGVADEERAEVLLREIVGGVVRGVEGRTN